MKPQDAARAWAPAVVTVAAVGALLLAAGAPPAALAAYAAYGLLAVLLPGTLVFRALRRRPHTLVEDLTYGAIVGLALELPAWALFSLAGAQRWLWLWPVLVIAPFLAAPRLRRHWRPTYPTAAPRGWSWSVSAVIVGFAWYLSESFLFRNPVLPGDDSQQQYIDLAFQLSLAGEATHSFPLDVPQAAGEPLRYHWFGFAHMAAASLISGVDLPTVFFRLAVPALCALAALAAAVTGWRISARPYAGALAAALMFAIGEFGFENGVRQLFGTQATFIVWGSPSMTYSWVLLLPLIATAAGLLRGPTDGDAPPPFGRGGWALLALLLLASTGAKASSAPVVAGAAAFAVLVCLWRRRPARPAWALFGAAVAAQAFATVVLFNFESHGVVVDPFSGLRPYVEPGAALGWVAVTVAFALNMQLRLAGIAPLLWSRRGRLDPDQAFLAGGALAGPAVYLALGHPGSSNQYFLRAAFAFGVMLSAWGYVELWERSALTRAARWRWAVGAAAVGFALVAAQFLAGPAGSVAPPAHRPLLPLLLWAALLTVVAAVAFLGWRLACGPGPLLRRRLGLAALTLALVAGAPGLPMDAAANRASPNGGAYVNVPMPRTLVDAARHVHRHSRPDDIVATNAHCREIVEGHCDARSFWLSAYAERTVLIEGWAFAPRAVSLGTSPYGPFWDQALFGANEAAFTAPTAQGLTALRDRHGVRWLVVDRQAGRESAALAALADLSYQNGRAAVYRLRE
ncbi:hypothetical protein [Pilimelia columellifera]|uniref:hypothetical protein n=1 Tax=Pilimelia columellifera TaxID=706574 RepID=UPI0031D21C86